MRMFSAIVCIIAGIIVIFGITMTSLAFPGEVPLIPVILTCIFLFGFAGYQLWMRKR